MTPKDLLSIHTAGAFSSASHATQAYFESGFPHGANQFISAAATNWATQAIILGSRN